jgi:hypothetical protein
MWVTSIAAIKICSAGGVIALTHYSADSSTAVIKPLISSENQGFESIGIKRYRL